MDDGLVTVLSSGNPVVLALAKVALQGARIRFVVAGEGVQDLIGLGRFPAGYNAATGPVRIQVVAQHAARARRALVGIGDASSE